VLYDLANTIFSLNIVSFYFSLWVVNEMGGTDQAYGNANSISMLLMFLSAPVLGALSDQAPRRKPFLILCTVMCVLFTLPLGMGGLPLSLLLFIVANYFFQAGLIFYDALLSEVSTEETRGRVGGLGIGFGYVGSIIGIVTGRLILGGTFGFEGSYANVFQTTGLLFLVLAIPAFLFLRERPRLNTDFGLKSVGRALREVRGTVVRARQYPGLARFLVGRIFYADAANTLITFMGVYVTNDLGFTSDQAQQVLLVGILTAIPGGILWGRLVDRIGPKRTLAYVLWVWIFLLSLTVAIPLLNLPTTLFWLAAALAGAALGGTWSADRPYMLRLSPPRYLGQFYGLYSMVGRFASIIGPAMWGLIVTTLDWGRPAAVASLIVLIVISQVILRGVSDTPRQWTDADLAAP